ncbi:MAG: carboxypeptidase-like regulatory domain-containing protein, partial [Polyangiales bacterium]
MFGLTAIVLAAAASTLRRGFASSPPVGASSGSVAPSHPSLGPHATSASGVFAGVIRGCVTDEKTTPLTTARICASFERSDASPNDPFEAACGSATDDGCYSLSVTPGRYTLVATAPDHLPAQWTGSPAIHTVTVGADDTRAGVDFTLASGGVTASGEVRDYLARPIGGATVDAIVDGMTVTTHTDAQGDFSLSVGEGDLALRAIAPGYAPSVTSGHAPGHAFELTLDPESVVTGHVVDADTHAALADARVCVDVDPGVQSLGDVRRCARSAVDGSYRLERLSMGRYKPSAIALRRRGVASESVRLGFGETSRDVVIEAREAFTVSGRVLLEGTPAACPEGTVSLRDELGNGQSAAIDAVGTASFEAVSAGAYRVRIACPGYVGVASAALLSIGADATDLVWTVRPGAVLRGVVADVHGAPVADADVQSGSAHVRSDRDGRFAIDGVGELGTVTVAAEGFVSSKAQWRAVGGRTPTDLRLVLTPGTTLIGDVVDGSGAPLANVSVDVTGGGGDPRELSPTVLTDDRGAFVLRGVSLRADKIRGRSRGGSTVEAPVDLSAHPARVHLVLDTEDGVVRGRVVEPDGTPVVEATVRALKEDPHTPASALASLRAGVGTRARTNATGEFTLAHLARGTYALRADSAGREGVASSVILDSTVKLTLRPTRRLSGTVTTRKGAPATDFDLKLTAPDDSVVETEHFSSSTGAFSFDGLPSTSILATASTKDAIVKQPVSLVDDDAPSVQLVLVPQSHLRGRMVWMEGGASIEAMDVFASGVSRRTESDGAFDLLGLAPGLATIAFTCASAECYPGTDRPTYAERTVRMPAEGDLDLGTLT